MDPRSADRSAPLPGFEHINRYWDRGHAVWASKLLPGEYVVIDCDEVIVTVLGSCVAACIRDPVARIGGMNHFMLPVHPVLGTGGPRMEEYGIYAMERLVNDLLKMGARRDRLEVKLVGGAGLIGKFADIGRRNVEFARAFVASDGLALAAEDVGGDRPRKAYYFPATGRVRIKRLQALANDVIIERESTYLDEIQHMRRAGDVELF